MLEKVIGCALFGLEGLNVDVEVNVSRGDYIFDDPWRDNNSNTWHYFRSNIWEGGTLKEMQDAYWEWKT